jgi:hypothetical protein
MRSLAQGSWQDQKFVKGGRPARNGFKSVPDHPLGRTSDRHSGDTPKCPFGPDIQVLIILKVLIEAGPETRSRMVKARSL